MYDECQGRVYQLAADTSGRFSFSTFVSPGDEADADGVSGLVPPRLLRLLGF